MIRRIFALTESGPKEISNKEPNVPIPEPTPLITDVRRIRYMRSTFTPHNSNPLLVAASIPLPGTAEMNDKFVQLRTVLEKVGTNSTMTVTLYVHNAAVADGAAVPGGAVQIGTFTSTTGQLDIPFERMRMYVKGSNIYPSRPDFNMLSDAVAQNVALAPIAIPGNAHLILATRVAHSGDTVAPKFITLEI